MASAASRSSKSPCLWPQPLNVYQNQVFYPKLIQRSWLWLKMNMGFGENSEFVCLGGFKNVRGVYEWKGLKLELDETIYGFGTCYEIECESLEPERDKKLIEGFLEENGIEYEYSQVSKFAVFRSGKLPD
ncbi:hypothetical protein Patl1_34621 [Pistacia atlantica]|uniref:Uncharacterized protein n=1 Tax=Pistacia atlantica TaxID=434234 RepID=A0ACC0ZS94_9ROSI|nr:hypothetical protein Patl1_34621 [Pistacia atlantica]